ncbi:Nucleotidyl transferase AbiEii toxin, Type IV TA system [Flagellimonas taeanensis]|uniref:Nucleotidyl transferase AbiEii toxin, Type IV TA system n=1 Tax=Flagellimonas taeanensis TaxID=1005926 RepID=A0A1M6SHW6_9FLAO|nr:nucleotidyl transferase AbiEii/AbiGii toxin family protein [Allomuricauda taeanensis]SFB80868.1 Nucleotidyl transferase AbiEii toxin, Type IV TA system [Allomuricauda taeanensis]SHK44265.1 Nucleotidyl transferase AbiEii toxin, Type IV TA system [Allomuricauda taeanensis]
MSTSNHSFKAYSFAHHGEVYRILEKVFAEHGVNYYLIGANARDIALYRAGERPIRATADIDFAVMVPDHDRYNAIKLELKKYGFDDVGRNMPYRMFHEGSKTVLDLLPFGGIEENRMVSFLNEKIELSAVGMQQVAEDIEMFEHPEGFSIPFSPAHGLVILKLIAWSEKPEMRMKDLGDTAEILRIAWALYEPELYRENAEHADLFGLEDFEMHSVSARIMGRKMQRILKLDRDLGDKIKGLLQKELDAETGPLTLALAKALDKDLGFARKIVRAMQTGILEFDA